MKFTNHHPTAEQIAAAAETAPVGVWLVAGTPTDRPYPCRCGSTGCGGRCPCRGRTEGEALPLHCCARPAHETLNRNGYVRLTRDEWIQRTGTMPPAFYDGLTGH